ncbi:hypothetical protein [Vogesella indigofera]|uniref:hypothetical protein n=1 Tax=Vogesella indigofera TaxID=45465 RepID=UPI00234EA2BA|nr:hypothetical protein [Vogesella indigofera]MDC7700310.1 hypothetical protein [Vogesella indigofera]
MKKVCVVAALGLFVAASAHAGSGVGACLSPKSKVASDGRLQFQKPVYLYAAPDRQANKQLLTLFSSLTVTAVAKGGWVRLATVPDYSQADPSATAGKVVGWALVSDFSAQAPRNCA